MGQVRIHGDPFGDHGASSLMRGFLRLALASGVRCSLSLAAVEPRAPRAGERTIALSDGGCTLRVATRLPPAEIQSLLRASGVAVAATVPVVVFAPAATRADAVRAAGLAWPRATAVFAARAGDTAQELLERVRAESRWAGREDPPHALDERELLPWLQLPAPGRGPIVAVGDGSFASGLDLAIAVWRQQFARGGHRLRLVVDGGGADTVAALRALLGDGAAGAEVVAAAFHPDHVRNAAALLLPFRRFTSPRLLVLSLASGRPVCASRFAACAGVLAGSGICLPIGGRNVDGGDGGPHFAPHAAAIAAALHQAVDEVAASDAIGMRARTHVLAELTRDQPAPPPTATHRPPPARPVLVLEAPFFAAGARAEVAIATAQALVRRDRADVRLVATVPARCRLAGLRARAPELVAQLCRDPGVADLWLSAGLPLRASRPPCRSWLLRVDLDHGALPLELTPHVTQDADGIVVATEHELRAVTAAGRRRAEVELVPHGVCAAMHEAAAADTGIVAWKQGRPAVLFRGEPDWLAGIDLFLRAVLGAHKARELCAVLVYPGHDRRSGSLQLGERIERFRRTPGSPPLLVIERELSRAELAAVHSACDLMLHAHRGVSAGLAALEARACGLPVLATAGALPGMDGPGAIAIPATLRDVDLPQPHACAPWVLEPSAADSERLLVATLADLPAHQRAARAFAPTVRASFSWDAAAAALEQLAFAGMAQRRLPAPAAGEPVVTLLRGHAPSLEPARS